MIKAFKAISIIIFSTPILFSQNIEEKPASLLGNLFNGGSSLNEYGINLGSSLTIDWINNIHGGIERKSDYCGLFSLSTQFDLNKIISSAGSELYFEMMGITGGIAGEFIGSFQNVSNIEAHKMIRIYEGWFKQMLFNDKFYLLIGIRDFNSGFDFIETASVFLNSSHGLGCEISESGHCGPSTYPYTGLGVELSLTASDNLALKGIASEAMPGSFELNNWNPNFFSWDEGLFIASEIELSFNKSQNSEQKRNQKFAKQRRYGSGRALRRNNTLLRDRQLIKRGICGTRFKLGGWYYTASFDNPSDQDEFHYTSSRKDNFGIYTSIEDVTVINNFTQQQVRTFLRLGAAHPEYNPVHLYFGAGILINNILTSDDSDKIGLAVSFSKVSEKYHADFFKQNYLPYKFETILELTYRYDVTDYFTIQPDVQYIINPGIFDGNKDALVFSFRADMILH